MPLSHSQTNQLLKELGHEPRKQLGQNFLIDGNIVQKSVRMADLKPGEHVVEVGPGLGTLTECMLEKGAQVYAVEFDRKLHQHLSESLQPRFAQSFHLLYGDALDHPLAQLPVAEILSAASNTGSGGAAASQPTAATGANADTISPSPAAQGKNALGASQPTAATDANALAASQPAVVQSAGATTRTGDFKIIANLPYAISTPWLEAVLSGPLRPTRMVLMLQKEAAERFVADPGNKTYGAISIFTASAYRTLSSHAVSRQCFFPIPGVDSVLLALEALPEPQPWPPLARALVRQFFIHRRKQIGSLVRRAIDEIHKSADTSKQSRRSQKQQEQAEELGHGVEAPDPQGASQRLQDWLVTLDAQGVSHETRPEAIPLAAWQALAQAFTDL